MSVHSRLWRVAAIRGTFSLLFGLIALTQPLQTMTAVLILLGLLLFTHPYATVGLLMQLVGLSATICGGFRLLLAVKMYSRLHSTP